jgi:hypothetical protein
MVYAVIKNCNLSPCVKRIRGDGGAGDFISGENRRRTAFVSHPSEQRETNNTSLMARTQPNNSLEFALRISFGAEISGKRRYLRSVGYPRVSSVSLGRRRVSVIPTSVTSLPWKGKSGICRVAPYLWVRNPAEEVMHNKCRPNPQPTRRHTEQRRSVYVPNPPQPVAGSGCAC